jgi:hypothetical protein
MKWLELAQNLPTNKTTRSDCPENCGNGGTLIINHKSDCYTAYCFRCGYQGYEGKGKQNLKELARIRELNEQAETIELTLELPDDYTTEIPLHGRLWLYGGGLTESVWRENRIGYSPSLDRVILPVYDNESNLIWYQCRALLKGQKPKYLQPSRNRDRVVFHKRPDKGTNERAVVVEDVLSAIRVGRHIPTYSLLGTKITSGQASMLAEYNKITTWLDPDRAGRHGAYKIRKTLGLLTEVDNIVTEKDPKELSDKQIKELLWHGNTTH